MQPTCHGYTKSGDLPTPVRASLRMEGLRMLPCPGAPHTQVPLSLPFRFPPVSRLLYLGSSAKTTWIIVLFGSFPLSFLDASCPGPYFLCGGDTIWCVFSHPCPSFSLKPHFALSRSSTHILASVLGVCADSSPIAWKAFS